MRRLPEREPLARRVRWAFGGAPARRDRSSRRSTPIARYMDRGPARLYLDACAYLRALEEGVSRGVVPRVGEVDKLLLLIERERERQPGQLDVIDAKGRSGHALAAELVTLVHRPFIFRLLGCVKVADYWVKL